jgi:hypothetical protein
VAVIPKSGPYTDEIIPPQLWPAAHEAAAIAATSFVDARQQSESAADTYRRAGRRLAETSEGATSEALITVHQELAVDHDNHAAIRELVAKAASQAAERGHELTNRLKAIDFETHQEIAASPPAARNAIITEARTRAMAVHAEFAAAVTSHHRPIPMNATRDAKATAQTDLGWRHMGWPLLFCWCCDYFDRLSGPLGIVEKPAPHADVFETGVAATLAATGKLRSRYVKL